MIAYGTRGDVQPAIALGKALQAKGHQVRLLASANFKSWVEQHGLEAATSHVDIQAVMESEGGKEWTEHGNNPRIQLQVMRKLVNKVGWEMMLDAWHACHDAQAIISSFTSDAYAVSMAEKLQAKQISMPLQPSLIPTRYGFATMNAPLPNRVSRINYLFTKLLVVPMMWYAFGGSANRFRQQMLGLPARNLHQQTAALRKMLVVHGYSQHVVPHPSDWPPNLHTTGYWFLEEAAWQPPPALLNFLAAGDAPVSIGFGSMTNRDPAALTQLVLEAVQQSGQRAILLAGWAGIGEADIPANLFSLAGAPHDWLFPRMAAVVHHGGAGTTAAGLRAGVPTVIVPHLGDQPFWGQRIATLGVGPQPIPSDKLTASGLAQTIRSATNDPLMRQRATNLGAKIRAEDGVGLAVDLIEQYLRGKTSTALP